MNGDTGRSSEMTSAERGYNESASRRCRREREDSKAGSRRPHGHDPVPAEIDVDGVPIAVDRCRNCGIVVLDSSRPGGPCSGPNHTLDEFGITPPDRTETDERTTRWRDRDRSVRERTSEETPVPAPR